MRDQTACMMRCKNESRWIVRSLERTWQVCRTVVIWDDGSTDNMDATALLTLGAGATQQQLPWGWVAESEEEDKVLHWLYSPYTSNMNPSMRVNEIRDKRDLWAYCQANVPFDTMLCLDGDELLSRQALKHWQKITNALAAGYDLIHLNVLYCWDSENQIRTDGIYGATKEGLRRLNFPRVFTTRRVSQDDLFMMTFAWLGSHSFHCGSIPRSSFLVGPKRQEPKSVALPLDIVHFGYLEEAERQRKYEFYNRIDPDNPAENGYLHIIGKPNKHAPGPVALAPYQDE